VKDPSSGSMRYMSQVDLRFREFRDGETISSQKLAYFGIFQPIHTLFGSLLFRPTSRTLSGSVLGLDSAHE
jgi:hypothetical protein